MYRRLICCLMLAALFYAPATSFAETPLGENEEESPTTMEYFSLGMGAIVVAGLIVYLFINQEPDEALNFTPTNSTRIHLVSEKGLLYIGW